MVTDIKRWTSSAAIKIHGDFFIGGAEIGRGPHCERALRAVA